MTGEEFIEKYGDREVAFDGMYKGELRYTVKIKGTLFTFKGYDSGGNYRTDWGPTMMVSDVEWESIE